ncbi:MAG: hypothetical protein ACPGAP_05040 [Akkermansiaceae bacterium]
MAKIRSIFTGEFDENLFEGPRLTSERTDRPPVFLRKVTQFEAGVCFWSGKNGEAVPFFIDGFTDDARDFVKLGNQRLDLILESR